MVSIHSTLGVAPEINIVGRMKKRFFILFKKELTTLLLKRVLNLRIQNVFVPYLIVFMIIILYVSFFVLKIYAFKVLREVQQLFGDFCREMFYS